MDQVGQELKACGMGYISHLSAHGWCSGRAEPFKNNLWVWLVGMSTYQAKSKHRLPNMAPMPLHMKGTKYFIKSELFVGLHSFYFSCHITVQGNVSALFLWRRTWLLTEEVTTVYLSHAMPSCNLLKIFLLIVFPLFWWSEWIFIYSRGKTIFLIQGRYRLLVVCETDKQ